MPPTVIILTRALLDLPTHNGYHLNHKKQKANYNWIFSTLNFTFDMIQRQKQLNINWKVASIDSQASKAWRRQININACMKSKVNSICCQSSAKKYWWHVEIPSTLPDFCCKTNERTTTGMTVILDSEPEPANPRLMKSRYPTNGEVT